MRLSLRLALLVLVALVFGTVYSFQNTSSAQRIKPNVEAVSCIAAPPGMVAWWPGEGDGKDIRGENDGTLQGGVTFPAGEVEHAFSFDGTNAQGVLIGNPASLQLQDFTIDAWTKRSSPDFTTVTGPLGAGAIVAYGHDGYGLGMFSDGRLELSKVDGVFVDSGSSPRVTDTDFHHIAVTKSGNNVVFYVDGVPGAPITFNETFAFTKNLSIGARLDLSAPTTSATDTSTFAGLIDELEIFSRALPQGEIQAIFAAGTAGKCRPRCVTPDDSLVGWWTGDDNPYDIWNQNHGTFEPGPSPSPSASPYANGKVGHAFNFDGSGSYVEFLDTYSDLDLTDAITIDAWVRPTGIPPGPPVFLNQNGKVKPNQLGGGYEAILTKWRSSQFQPGSVRPEQSGDSYGLWLTSEVPQTGKPAGATPSTPVQTSLTLYAAVETGECGTTSLFGGTVPLNVWSHVAMTYDSTTGTLALYVNGVRVNFESCETNDPIIQTATQVNIGCQTCGTAVQPVDPFQGQIDEVEVFDLALDQSQIQDINNGASAGKCKPCYAPPLRMVGWWTGDANTRDESLTGNDGTWQGNAAYSFGEVGQAFKFDGSGSSISVPESGSLDFGTLEFTLDAWVNPTDLSNSPMILSKWGGSNDSYELHLQPDGSVRANISGDGTTLDALVSSAGVVTTGAWSHVATTFNDGDWSIYVNGVKVGSKTSAVSGPFAGSANLLIGRDIGTIHNFNGLIDEVEVFDRDLSQPEIQSIVAAGASGKCKSVSHSMVMDKARGSRARTATKSPVHPNDIQTDQVGDATVTMVDVTNSGSTDYQTLPTYQQGPLPFGYGDPLEIADISTTTTFNGAATICFTLLSISDSQEDFFNHLRILHLEGNILFDRTSSHYFPTRSLCATVPADVGFSPFVISQNQNLAPSAANGNIGGTITDASGAAVSGVTINLSGTESRDAITDSGGHYFFDNVETNGFYTVTPSRANYTFTPANRSFSLLGVHTDASFTATANNSKVNPLDTNEFFLRQHYLDFLGREPDAPGFAGWVSTLNNCAAGDPSCDRVHVSEAFYRSQEFQERGYFAYRFYSTALGRKPDYAEFAPDLARVSGFLSTDQLEAAKSAFVDDFMARPAFARQYDSLSDTAFVDTLIQTSGVDLSSSRQALIDGLRTGRLGRAAVLREIAESSEVYQKYYNQAFVVMEYFGYLHRDPDALYTDWIRALDANPTDSRRMVEGFVNSAEYRNRFVQ